MSEQPRIHQRRDSRGPDILSAEKVLNLFPSAKSIIENATKEGDFDKARTNTIIQTQVNDAEVFSLANISLEEMKTLEKAARNPEKWNISPELASSIKLIVVFSAPGTYTESVKEDRHRGQEYAIWMDRQRADLATRISVLIAGKQTGRDLLAFAHDDIIDGFDPTLRKLRDAARESITESELSIIYSGTPAEVQAIRAVLNSPASYIPRDSVEIIEGQSDNYNTYNQVEDLKKSLPRYNLRKGDGIVFVMGFQAVRTMRYCQQLQAIPTDINVYVFPTPTHYLGINQYAERETRGTLAGLISGQASFSPVPYIVMGK